MRAVQHLAQPGWKHPFRENVEVEMLAPSSTRWCPMASWYTVEPVLYQLPQGHLRERMTLMRASALARV